MTQHEGYYSIIQYCPSLEREEAVNVGVAVFSLADRSVTVRMTDTNAVVARRFGKSSFDDRRLSSEKAAFARRLRDRHPATLDDILQFIACEAGRLLPTQPRAMRVHEAEREADELFGELVASVQRKRRTAAPNLDVLMGPYLLGLEPRLRRNEEVVVPVLGKRFTATYAYRNGHINYVRPYGFSADVDSALTSAGQLGIQGRLLSKHQTDDGQNQQLIVVAAYEAPAVQHKVETLLGDCDVRCVGVSEARELAEEIRRDAH
jgi:hypothetical protein